MEDRPKLNIAVVCDGYEQTIGGSYVSLHRFVDKLCERGHNITVVTSENIDYKDFVANPDVNLKEFRASFALGPHKVRFAMFRGSSLLKVLKENNIDIVYFQTPTYSGYQSIRTARKMNIPLVCHFHLQAENVANVFPFLPTIRNAVVYRYLMYFYNHSDLVISPSEFGVYLLKLNKIEVPTTVISNGVLLDKFKKIDEEAKNQIRQKYGLSPTGLKLLAVSRLDPEKKVEVIVKAMPMILGAFPDAQLILVGSGKNTKQIKRLIKRLKLNNNIIVTGKVPAEDLTPLYNVADIFVHASLIELEGMVLLEAMACGLPLLVANATTSAAPYIVEGNGSLFIPNDSQDLAAKAIRMYSDTDKLNEMKKRSLELIPSYDIEKSIDKLEAAFYKLKQEYEKTAA